MPLQSRGPVDVTAMTVIGEEPALPRYGAPAAPSSSALLDVDDDEFPGREALAS